MSIGIAEYLEDPEEQQQAAIENQLANLRVAMPGIVQSFDPARQTATVLPAIMENIRQGDAVVPTPFPVLSDVPVVFPRGGGFSITMPVKVGDECLLVFADRCIDGWWQSGGVQNQMERRRHDLSDAFALMGVSSVPRAVAGYSLVAVQVRSDNGAVCLEIGPGGITMTAPQVTVKGNLSVTGTLDHS